MAISTRKYFLYIIFLVSPISLSLYAQNTADNQKVTVASDCELTTVSFIQSETTADVKISSADNNNQFIVRLSNPKDSLAIAAETTNKSADCEENSLISATSILAKDIIENYKYDFSETFIDILFFERIDLARTRTI